MTSEMTVSGGEASGDRLRAAGGDWERGRRGCDGDRRRGWLNVLPESR